MRFLILLALAALPLVASERTVDPTFLHRYVPDIREQKSDIATATCHYKAIFGAGDADDVVGADLEF